MKHRRALLALNTAAVVSVPVRQPGRARMPVVPAPAPALQLPLFAPAVNSPALKPHCLALPVDPSTPGPPAALVAPPTPTPTSLPGPAAPAAETLHPALWRAHQLARAGAVVLPSGFDALDLQLPGGGWPTGALTELLLPQPGVGELRLLAPLLAALHRAQRSVVWFDPPAMPCAAGLAELGLDMRRLVVVQGEDSSSAAMPGQARATGGASAQTRSRPLPAADTLWALEQALKSGHLGAVLAWLPARLPAEVLRRLQLAAQAHEGVALLLRHSSVGAKPSPAPLRLALSCAGPDRLRVTVLKRRGPPALQPLLLHLTPVLHAAAAARAALRHAAPVAASMEASEAA